ncbi:hypothetical protein EMIT0P260_40041 [Pseudomonas sp. IT-P260]
MLVQQEDVALETRGGRAVEQRQMANLRGDVAQVIALGGGDQALQGQVVQLDRAQDVGVDQLGDGGGAAGGRFLSVGVLTNQQKSDDAQNRDHGQRTAADQQQFGASGLARQRWGTARDHDGLSVGVRLIRVVAQTLLLKPEIYPGVGASLLAKALCHSTWMSNGRPLSRAGSLPQGASPN